MAETNTRQSDQSFPKTYEPSIAEAKWYEVWESRGYFRPEINPNGEPYCIVLPPPNITGSLHMGHAFEHALIDATIRRKRMQGYATLWLPGTDHAGIATQNVVERQLAEEGLTRHDLGREAFLERVWKWKEIAGGEILQQMRKMGNSCDWSRTRFTMEPALSRAVREVFVRLYKEGLIYRGERIINWCPRCNTALSDIEVDHEEIEGEIVEILYPYAHSDSGKGTPEGIVVATTRVETMLGDTAVAVHPSDERYSSAAGRSVILPIKQCRIPVIQDEAVDPEFGTGAVKVTPGHDPTDFEIGERHSLPIVNIFNPDATLNEEGGEFAGLDRFEARRKIKEKLQELGLLVSERSYTHAVGHCQRCETQVEPLVSKQWFVKVRPLSEPALKAVLDGRTKFFPERWVKIYRDWLENIRDWCISRQLWWGHQIPVFYCNSCGAEICENEDPDQCPQCSSQDIEQDPDVLDTWFSSALWPFSTLGWPEETEDLKRFYPNSMLHTGFDIIFFWVARMMQMGIHFMGDVPFYHVAYHGLVRDSKGRKMSKSFGNVIDPLELAGKYGADSLRWALTRAATPGQDVPLSEEWVEGARHFINKLWNASRYVCLTLEGESLASLSEQAPSDDLPTRWIFSRLRKTIRAVDEAFDCYNFAEALRHIHAFFWSEFCDWYVELTKSQLAETTSKEASLRLKAALAKVLEAVLALAHPAIPYVTEELWERLGGSGHLIVARWPRAEAFSADPEAEARMQGIQDIVTTIRRFRSAHRISPSTKLRASVVVTDGAGVEQESPSALASDLEILRSSVTKLAGLSHLKILDQERDSTRSEGSLRLAAQLAQIWIETAGVFDIDEESKRIRAQLAKVEAEIERASRKLEDSQFVSKAPVEVVEKERAKLEAFFQERASLEEALADLGQHR
ncbi:MAG: valine--tRNA ligase [Acidimicrobiia bacterium]